MHRLLITADCGEYLRPPPSERGLASFRGEFEEGELRLKKALDLVVQGGLSFRHIVFHEYSDDELCSFPLLKISIDCDPIGSKRSPGYGTSYDLKTACPNCGTGAIQTSSLALPPKLPSTLRGLFHGPGFELIVGERLMKALLDCSVTGIELRPTLATGGAKPHSFWQIIAKTVMPRMSLASKNLGRETRPGWGCNLCKRDMHICTNNEPLDFVYDAKELDLINIPDFVQTWECWGRSVLTDNPERQLVRGYASPWYLIKPKVFRIIRELGLSNVSFDPVRIV